MREKWRWSMCRKTQTTRDREQWLLNLHFVYHRGRERETVLVKTPCHAESAGMKFEWVCWRSAICFRRSAQSANHCPDVWVNAFVYVCALSAQVPHEHPWCRWTPAICKKVWMWSREAGGRADSGEAEHIDSPRRHPQVFSEKQYRDAARLQVCFDIYLCFFRKIQTEMMALFDLEWEQTLFIGLKISRNYLHF